MKKLWKDIQTGVRALIVLTIVSWLSAAGSAVARLARGLSISDNTVLPMQLCLLGFGFVLACFSGWFLFFQARKKIQLVERQLQDSLTAPFKVSDDYVFDTNSGYWIHTGDFLRVCNDCLLPPTKIVSPLFEAVGSGMEYEDEYVAVWRCGKCGRDYRK
jgi:hypothetical protein